MNYNNRIVVVGAQWGDEGKGKVIDYLAAKADLVARFQGGNNAGHTVVYGANIFKLHHVPSGILNEGTTCLLGNGMVVDPLVLVDEISELEKRGINTEGLRISNKAHLNMLYHRVLDEENEKLLGEKKIGTTGRGIGPAYADKVMRRGIRAVDMIDFEAFRRRLEEILPLQNIVLNKIYDHKGYDLKQLLEIYRPSVEKLGPLVSDTSLILAKSLYNGDKILFEGAQGALLDLDHGTYPYVTSSSTTAAAAATGNGIGPQHIDQVLGVIKAYTTRVGEGPFPTEDHSEAGVQLRERGNEFGTTTGRPRRCGWFDTVIARYAARINGLTGLAVTKLDVLSGMDTVKIGVSYDCENRNTENFPTNIEELSKCNPVFETLPGWDEDISRVRSIEDLPDAARQFLEVIEEKVGVRIELLSVGPDRSQTIIKENSTLKNWLL